MDLRIVENRVDPLAASPVQHAPGLRRLVRQEHACDRIRLLASDRLDSQSVSHRKGDQHDPSGDQLAKPFGDEPKQSGKVELAHQRIPDLVQRFELS